MSSAELIVVLIITLLVLKPKDIPHVFRFMGKTLAKIRQWHREFIDWFDYKN